ncbi:uncharacterized protein MONBRDRAFT_35975 [Monosiga brevicollis MX1]|uniref:SH2 domain-containing protein n=1 Tax=Monosiga brevicollis TaxID=81824 RepID=A9UR47_MONBE|nr:uncharacterized protein MONBRDRAFT_35975 [Monosiga brevicollis MX1]EDQ91854.1 predicted protein [Monosiga brevicollis MX1]|eukprot:XP_001743140.1 hypothetical protein [Monosiga brevicollis MX1]
MLKEKTIDDDVRYLGFVHADTNDVDILPGDEHILGAHIMLRTPSQIPSPQSSAAASRSTSRPSSRSGSRHTSPSRSSSASSRRTSPERNAPATTWGWDRPVQLKATATALVLHEASDVLLAFELAEVVLVRNVDNNLYLILARSSVFPGQYACHGLKLRDRKTARHVARMIKKFRVKARPRASIFQRLRRSSRRVQEAAALRRRRQSKNRFSQYHEEEAESPYDLRTLAALAESDPTAAVTAPLAPLAPLAGPATTTQKRVWDGPALEANDLPPLPPPPGPRRRPIKPADPADPSLADSDDSDSSNVEGQQGSPVGLSLMRARQMDLSRSFDDLSLAVSMKRPGGSVTRPVRFGADAGVSKYRNMEVSFANLLASETPLSTAEPSPAISAVVSDDEEDEEDEDGFGGRGKVPYAGARGAFGMADPYAAAGYGFVNESDGLDLMGPSTPTNATAPFTLRDRSETIVSPGEPPRRSSSGSQLARSSSVNSGHAADLARERLHTPVDRKRGSFFLDPFTEDAGLAAMRSARPGTYALRPSDSGETDEWLLLIIPPEDDLVEVEVQELADGRFELVSTGVRCDTIAQLVNYYWRSHFQNNIIPCSPLAGVTA